MTNILSQKNKFQLNNHKYCSQASKGDSIPTVILLWNSGRGQLLPSLFLSISRKALFWFFLVLSPETMLLPYLLSQIAQLHV